MSRLRFIIKTALDVLGGAIFMVLFILALGAAAALDAEASTYGTVIPYNTPQCDRTPRCAAYQSNWWLQPYQPRAGYVNSVAVENAIKNQQLFNAVHDARAQRQWNQYMNEIRETNWLIREQNYLIRTRR